MALGGHVLGAPSSMSITKNNSSVKSKSHCIKHDKAKVLSFLHCSITARFIISANYLVLPQDIPTTLAQATKIKTNNGDGKDSSYFSSKNNDKEIDALCSDNCGHSLNDSTENLALDRFQDGLVNDWVDESTDDDDMLGSFFHSPCIMHAQFGDTSYPFCSAQQALLKISKHKGLNKNLAVAARK